MENEMKIYVFADFLTYQNDLIGIIYVSQTRGKEFCSFEYDGQWLEKQNMVLDPDLQLYKGRQYINDDKNIFGMFADSCPDRWGQRLMKRREEIRARKAEPDRKPLLWHRMVRFGSQNFHPNMMILIREPGRWLFMIWQKCVN